MVKRTYNSKKRKKKRNTVLEKKDVQKTVKKF